jgi:hypothetical protein
MKNIRDTKAGLADRRREPETLFEDLEITRKMMGLFFTQDLSQGQLQKLFTTVVNGVSSEEVKGQVKGYSTQDI